MRSRDSRKYCPSCHKPMGNQAEEVSMVRDPVEDKKIYYHNHCPMPPAAQLAFRRWRERDAASKPPRGFRSDTP